MGDGGGRLFDGDRDKTRSARRMLVSFCRDDPASRAVHAFNETTPRCSAGNDAYKDFAWRDTTAPKGDLEHFKRSHIRTGPGYVYARSSWAEDATYFFFKCGDRFTARQHLDAGNFLIFKGDELVGDTGSLCTYPRFVPPFEFGKDVDNSPASGSRECIESPDP